MKPACCNLCNRPYGDQNGFPDLIIPNWAWQQISPHGDEGGLLCPSCICQRLHDLGIRCEGAFTSGPIESIDQMTMLIKMKLDQLEENLDRVMRIVRVKE